MKRKKGAPEKPSAPPGPSRWAGDPDVQLMLRFQKGDEPAFEELVQCNTHKVHALVYRFLGDPSAVEDITQEVFLRVYRTAPRYMPTAKFSTWLYRITANLCFNVLRSRKRRSFVPLETGDSDDGGYHHQVPDDRQVSPFEGMDTAELSDMVAEAIAQLPDNQRVAIVLNKYEQKSYEEIAAVLKCSSMAVKSLLSRARGNLRVALGRYIRP